MSIGNNFNYEFNLIIEGNILSGNYCNVKNINGNYIADHNLNINLNHNNYNVEIESVIDDGPYSDDYCIFRSGKESLKSASVGIISKLLFGKILKRAAIRNDIEIGNELFNSFNNIISNKLSQSSYQNNFFNMYTKTSYFNYSNDLSTVVNYKFNNSMLQFIIPLSGNIIESDLKNILLNSNNKVISGYGFKDNNFSIIDPNTNNVIYNYSNTGYQTNILLKLKHID